MNFSDTQIFYVKSIFDDFKTENCHFDTMAMKFDFGEFKIEKVQNYLLKNCLNWPFLYS